MEGDKEIRKREGESIKISKRRKSVNILEVRI
jgi:hypothetical protein